MWSWRTYDKISFCIHIIFMMFVNNWGMKNMASKDNVLEIRTGPVVIFNFPVYCQTCDFENLCMNFSFDLPYVQIFDFVVTYALLVFMPFYCRSGYGKIHNRFAYVLLRLRVQNRRKKWNFPPNFRNGIIWTAPFPLDIRNIIIWGMVFPKHLGLQKHLFWYSLKMPACMIIFKILFRQKHCTLYLYSMVMSRYQFMNLKFLYLSKNMPTEHQLLVTVLAYRKDCRRRFRYDLDFSCLD